MELNCKKLTDEYRNVLDIRYTQFEFTLRFQTDGILPKSKASAIRGGLGDAMLRKICINDRKCDSCNFFDECIIQHMLYTRMGENRPDFMTNGDSLGYIIDCDDETESVKKGDTIRFSLILFGKTIVHAGFFIDAVAELGSKGIGKEKLRFNIDSISCLGRTLDKGKALLKGMTIERVSDYVSRRLLQIEMRGFTGRLIIESPISLKHNGNIMNYYDMEVFLQALKRRIYMLDCFENIDGENFYKKELPIPDILEEKHQMTGVTRYSSRHDEKITFKGLEGFIQLGEISEEILPLLLAGEVLHVGKQTSFGFGKYMVR